MLPTRVVRGRKNPGYLTLPERLRRTRKAAGLPGSVLSLAAGLNQSITSKLETGQWVPLLQTVELLADALRVSPAYLAFGGDVSWEAREGDALRCAGLAQRAKEAREARGLSLREAGRLADLSEGAIRSMERGTVPTLDTLEAVANALRVSPSWLAYGIGEMELIPKRGGKGSRHS